MNENGGFYCFVFAGFQPKSMILNDATKRNPFSCFLRLAARVFAGLLYS
jgi:hypothetical protein